VLALHSKQVLGASAASCCAALSSTVASVVSGAVIALTKAAGKEYAESGITVNALAPAVVRTAMVDAMPEEQVKYMTGELNGGKGARADDARVARGRV
jgi:3-oxoacyl-[acyl-carrier protein] reductase